MAEALTQSTGRPQIVAVSRAVGAANAAVGIHTAAQDSAPMVALAGQVARSVAGREAFQESDLVGGIGSLALWAGQIDHAADAPTVLGKAWRRLHTGRPGPVLLSVPVGRPVTGDRAARRGAAQAARRPWPCRRSLRW